MESNVIREFLVALGFKLDRPALQNFEQGIHKATRAALGLATAVEGMALTVGLGIARFSSNLEQLYFAAQRTGSSATALKAFQRTAQNFGASAGDALGSVEGLAQAMRMNPGNVGLLEGLGVHLERTKNGSYDATDALVQFGNRMRALGYFKPGEFYMAEQYAGMLGINERTLLALRNGNFNREFARMQREMHGHGFQKAAQDAHRFMVSLRNLETQLEVFGAQVEDAIQRKLGVNLKHLSAWLQQHGPQIAGQLVTAATQLYQVAEWISRAVAWLVPKFESLNRETHGWAGKLLGLYTILRLFGGLEVISGVLRLGAAFGLLGARILGARAAAEGASAISAGGLAGAAVPGIGLGILAGWGVDKLFPNNWLAEAGRWIGGNLYDATHRDQTAMNYFTSQGWAPWQAAGIVANLEKESGLAAGATGDNGQAYGIAQWHPDRQAEFARIFGKNIRASSYMDQLAFVNWELRHSQGAAGRLLSHAKTAAAAGSIVSRFYERPAHATQEAQARALTAHRIWHGLVRQAPYLAQVQARYGAAGAPTINQETNIHVHASRDALGTARSVSGEQQRVNADMVRNFATAVR